MEVPINFADAPMWVVVVYGGFKMLSDAVGRIERLLAARSGQAPTTGNTVTGGCITSQTCDRCREGFIQRFNGIDGKLELLFDGQKEMQVTLTAVADKVATSNTAFIEYLKVAGAAAKGASK